MASCKRLLSLKKLTERNPFIRLKFVRFRSGVDLVPFLNALQQQRDIQMLGTRFSSGFTLIELMIVVAIIAVLAAIAIPSYQIYLIRAQVSEGMVLSAGPEAAVWEYYVNTGGYPPNNASAGLPVSPYSISGKYVASVKVVGGVITSTFGLASNSRINNGTFVLSAITNGGSIAWSCKSSSLSPIYLPTPCRK